MRDDHEVGRAANAALMLSLPGMAMADAETACREYIQSGRATRRLLNIRHASTETLR